MTVSNTYPKQQNIDWQAPWLAHLPSCLQVIDFTDNLPEKLNPLIANAKITTQSGFINHNKKTLSFVAQNTLPKHTAYESHIYDTGNIPTRDNLHDFFNAAVWLTFPKTKTLLNALQYQQIQLHGIGKKRGTIRDALTLFDENGAILVTCNQSIATALPRFDWQTTLVNTRQYWNKPYTSCNNSQAAVYLFGHAIMEQLVNPRKPICAHTHILTVTPDWFALSATQKLIEMDDLLVQYFAKQAFNTKSFNPLPVLGVPHFWAQNVDSAFYDDSYVFRSGRRKKQTT